MTKISSTVFTVISAMQYQKGGGHAKDSEHRMSGFRDDQKGGLFLHRQIMLHKGMVGRGGQRDLDYPSQAFREDADYE